MHESFAQPCGRTVDVARLPSAENRQRREFLGCPMAPADETGDVATAWRVRRARPQRASSERRAAIMLGGPVGCLGVANGLRGRRRPGREKSRRKQKIRSRRRRKSGYFSDQGENFLIERRCGATERGGGRRPSFARRRRAAERAAKAVGPAQRSDRCSDRAGAVIGPVQRSGRCTGPAFTLLTRPKRRACRTMVVVPAGFRYAGRHSAAPRRAVG